MVEDEYDAPYMLQQFDTKYQGLGINLNIKPNLLSLGEIKF